MKAIFVFCMAVFLLIPALSSATTLTVQVDQTQLRSEPSFFGKIIAKLRYRTPVELIEERGAWRLVKFNQQQGWMHVSAMVKTNLNLSSGQTLSGAVSGKEVSLAGKGFDATVEKAFKKSHRLSFVWVDRMVKMTISPSELEKFAADGDFSTVTR